ncbi:MAG TPA: copper transporter [Solirubrobacteraceae bacterium]
MFDYRYHALSLAAVLFALTVGVLIGVAIGDSNLVSSAKDGIVQNLRSEVSSSQHKTNELAGQLSSEETFAGDLYPIAVHGLLTNKSVGLVFLGGSSDQIDELVRNGVTQAGGNLNMVAAVREPLDLQGLASQATGTQYTALATNPALVKEFGVRMGEQLVGGGQLLGHVRPRLLSSYDGEFGKLDGLVVMRSQPTGMSSEAAKLTGEFESGLIEGATAAGVPTVGVELTSTEPSQIPWYKAENMASVDDLDAPAGQAALAFALAGDHGAYGVKPTANSLLPHVAGAVTQP